MNQKSIRLISYLLVASLLLTGCGNRLFWEKWSPKAIYHRISAKLLFQKAEAMKIQYDETPLLDRTSTDYEDLVSAYRKIINRYPTTYKALNAYFRIANLQIENEEFAKARETLKEMIKQFPFQMARAAEASFKIAQTYLFEDNWVEAEKAYWYSANHFPFDQPSMQAPMQILTHYVRFNAEDTARGVYKQVSEHYERISKQVKGTALAATVWSYLAMSHAMMHEWEAARDVYLRIANEYPDSPQAPGMLISAAEAMEGKGNMEAASEIYRDYLRRYPDNEHRGFIYFRLADIALKNKDLKKAIKYNEASLDHFAGDEYRSANIKLAIAELYEQLGDIAATKRAYRRIQADHPDTDVALRAPLLLAQFFLKQGDFYTAQATLEEAIQRYESKREKVKGSDAEVGYLNALEEAKKLLSDIAKGSTLSKTVSQNS